MKDALLSGLVITAAVFALSFHWTEPKTKPAVVVLGIPGLSFADLASQDRTWLGRQALDGLSAHVEPFPREQIFSSFERLAGGSPLSWSQKSSLWECARRDQVRSSVIAWPKPGAEHARSPVEEPVHFPMEPRRVIETDRARIVRAASEIRRGCELVLTLLLGPATLLKGRKLKASEQRSTVEEYLAELDRTFQYELPDDIEDHYVIVVSTRGLVPGVWISPGAGGALEDGVLLISGPGILRGSALAKLRLESLYATILHLLDVPLPPSCGEEPVTELIAPEIACSRPVRWRWRR